MQARKFVPQDLPLVELFGYTLGGLYLARYEDSPAGKFDEVRVDKLSLLVMKSE